MDIINTLKPDISYLIAGYELRSIEGKILTIVESIGLPEKQEDAVKGLARQAIWDTVNRPDRESFGWNEGTLYKLHQFFLEEQKSMCAQSTSKKSK